MIKGLSVVGEHEVETPEASGRRYESGQWQALREPIFAFLGRVP